MVDIHCHILPGLDDGAENLEMSRAMADMAMAEGITHIVGTPHASPNHPFNPAIVKQRLAELQARYVGRLTLATGCDFHMSFENLEDIRHEPERYTINQKNYLLVEFADYSIPPAMDHALHRLRLAGLHPIVTHPERNPLIRAQPDHLYRWLRQGCYAQVTAQSVLGQFGRAAQQMADLWLRAGAVHFIASDAHNVSSRPLRLKDAYKQVLNGYGENTARALLMDNPLAAFEGRPLPHVPELPKELGAEKPAGAQTKKRKRFWFFETSRA